MGKTLRILGSVFLLFAFSVSYAGEKTIVIDVSHGGKDNGFEIDGFKEKDLAFEIALKILTLNKDEKINIVLTRDADDFISLTQRVEFINSLNPDYVISLHINSSDDNKINGFEFFVNSDSALGEKSNALAKILESSISEEFPCNGIQNSNFYILKNVETPITLIEMGYLSNDNDRAILTSEYGQFKIAEAIYNTIK